MLVLSRKTRDAIVIGHNIRVMVLSIGRDQVRLGIEAPPDVDVHREEVFLAIQEANHQAAALSREAVESPAAVPRPSPTPRASSRRPRARGSRSPPGSNQSPPAPVCDARSGTVHGGRRRRSRSKKGGARSARR